MPETRETLIPTALARQLAERGAALGMTVPGYVEHLLRTYGRSGPTKSDPASIGGANEVTVRAESRQYRVAIGPALVRHMGEQIRAVLGTQPRRAFVVSDAGLPHDLTEGVIRSLTSAAFEVTTAQTDATEPDKSMEAANRLLRAVLASKHERTDPIITLGGGIVTDLGGFVAATYRRGVPVIHCPTTLLAMVDAAVGGKTGVNLALPDGSLAKNMVGAFWQPHLVLCDPDVLRSLPLRQLRAGMAECLKHALLSAGLADGVPAGGGRDAGLWAWTLDHLDACLRLDPAAMSELIARNIAVKAGVVSGDEREEAPSSAGGRALLNLGHTFAHAIETLPGLEPIPGIPANSNATSQISGVGSESRPTAAFMLHHGEAVGLGLIAAASASAKLGMIPESDADAVRTALGRAGLPIHVRGLPADDALIERMSHDKKNLGGTLRLILLKKLGEAVVVENPPMDAVRAGWSAIRA